MENVPFSSKPLARLVRSCKFFFAGCMHPWYIFQEYSIMVCTLYLYAFLMHFTECTLVKYVYYSSLCDNFRELIQIVFSDIIVVNNLTWWYHDELDLISKDQKNSKIFYGPCMLTPYWNLEQNLCATEL